MVKVFSTVMIYLFFSGVGFILGYLTHIVLMRWQNEQTFLSKKRRKSKESFQKAQKMHERYLLDFD